jgi:hypothetical protein
MNKLYWIVCEEGDTTLFEGRYQGRTRGSAMKFLKEQIDRKNLSGVVFTITEIPVPLIRELIAEMMSEMGHPAMPIPQPTSPPAEPEPEEPATPKAKPVPVASEGKPGNPGFGDDLWQQARAYWEACRCIRKTAEKFGLSPNSVKTRARREGWRK